jgi:hypothetical protein
MKEKLLVKYSSTLALIEVGLGSFLHSLKVPLTGQLLSLNQGFFLTKVSLTSTDIFSPLKVSVLCSLLKSLSPAGKKLTPMLAICIQGVLFNIGLILFGRNVFGRAMGMSFLCLWSYIQPVAIYYLIYGNNFFKIVEYYIKKLHGAFGMDPNNFIVIIAMMILVKIIVGLFVVKLAYRVSEENLDTYKKWAKEKILPKKKGKGPAVLMAFKDLMNPIFIFSYALSFFFYKYSQSVHAPTLWQYLRPITVGYFIFLIIRIFPVEIIVGKLKEGNFKVVFKETLKELKD